MEVKARDRALDHIAHPRWISTHHAAESTGEHEHGGSRYLPQHRLGLLGEGHDAAHAALGRALVAAPNDQVRPLAPDDVIPAQGAKLAVPKSREQGDADQGLEI